MKQLFNFGELWLEIDYKIHVASSCVSITKHIKSIHLFIVGVEDVLYGDAFTFVPVRYTDTRKLLVELPVTANEVHLEVASLYAEGRKTWLVDLPGKRKLLLYLL
ncbi:MAG: hypothetical protein JNM21_09670 [Taibaiella sp.]|nr:hypothetical protein [Taibaiella sp.]